MAITHGIKVTEINTGARAITSVASGVIGLIATAGAATGAPTTTLNGAFPIGELTLVTDVRAAIAAAGTAGTLAKALQAIADQCQPTIVVLRVAVGADSAANDTAILAALPKLLRAESQLGVRPRIIGAPGLDTVAVTTALIPIAQQLRGFLYAAATGATPAAAITYAGGFSARELMVIWPEFTDFTGSAVARALGLRARIDQEVGWHKTLSNVEVQGVTGISPAISFDMLNQSSNDAALLNDAKITTLIRPGGFRFWGNRTMASDPLFAFETTVRTAQVLQDEIAAGLVWAIDKPITASLVKDIVETVNARFRALGRIIGATCWFDPNSNPSTQLAAGTIVIDYDYTPCAPAEAILLNQRITDKYYASLADALK